MPTREEIHNGVVEVVTQVTLADKTTVTEASHLFEDLGVESIDFVDIIYNLESEFDTEIQAEDLFTDRDFFSPENGNFADGKLTPAGLEALEAFPYLKKAKAFGDEAQRYLYSIEMLVDFVEHRLGESG